jgi:hypothetical protein
LFFPHCWAFGQQAPSAVHLPSQHPSLQHSCSGGHFEQVILSGSQRRHGFVAWQALSTDAMHLPLWQMPHDWGRLPQGAPSR